MALFQHAIGFIEDQKLDVFQQVHVSLILSIQKHREKVSHGVSRDITVVQLTLDNSSQRRPGVATMMSGTSFNWRCCFWMDIPPTIATTYSKN
jgi:hypothetical protein